MKASLLALPIGFVIDLLLEFKLMVVVRVSTLLVFTGCCGSSMMLSSFVQPIITAPTNARAAMLKNFIVFIVFFVFVVYQFCSFCKL